MLGEWETDGYPIVKASTNHNLITKQLEAFYKHVKGEPKFYVVIENKEEINNKREFNITVSLYDKEMPSILVANYEVKGNRIIQRNRELRFYIKKENTLYIEEDIPENEKGVLTFLLSHPINSVKENGKIIEILNEEDRKELEYLAENPDKVKVNKVTTTFKLKRVK